jgi:hypothetical protein
MSASAALRLKSKSAPSLTGHARIRDRRGVRWDGYSFRDRVRETCEPCFEAAQNDCSLRQSNEPSVYLANEGTDTGLIQDFLGHASIASTVCYTRLAPGRLAAVRAR